MNYCGPVDIPRPKVDVVLSRTKWGEGPCGFPAEHKVLHFGRRSDLRSG